MDTTAKYHFLTFILNHISIVISNQINFYVKKVLMFMHNIAVKLSNKCFIYLLLLINATYFVI